VILAQFTLEMCVMAASNREQKSLKTILGSTSFKVIDVSTTGKLVSSACYDKREVCVYLTVLTLDELIVVK